MIPLLSSLHFWWGSLCSGRCKQTWVAVERLAVLCSPAGLQQSPPYRWWSWNRRKVLYRRAREAFLSMIMKGRTNRQGIPYPWSRNQWNWELELVFWLFLTDDSVSNNRVSSLWGERRLQPCWWRWTYDPAHHQSHSQRSLILSYCLSFEGFENTTARHLNDHFCSKGYIRYFSLLWGAKHEGQQVDGNGNDSNSMRLKVTKQSWREGWWSAW